ncbi:hypothetical protein EL22_07490 [Halostagnicola sp. A56]|uniref:hypothetical protein n=1 Tax=Halostagnicola sp. A56 TaxID=1495067 RepID=UPI00049F0307|nr:hypothetical protein [Halostagnicola sp. A56]KDE60199.1 hypothetical protein EL22_07490 [Halostagnicola sp. A56]
MKSLEVTDEQYAFVQHLREEISEQVVGKYGHVREKDAVQFLIDNLDGDLEIEGEFDAADVSADPLEDASEGDRLEEVSYDESDADAEADGDGAESDGGDGESDGEDDAGPDAEDDESADGDDAESDDDEIDENDDESDEGDGAADDDEMLDEMMSLLETHDDKWEESDSGDHRYSVELPDGSTEDVQTKDDVRAILFKNYR